MYLHVQNLEELLGNYLRNNTGGNKDTVHVLLPSFDHLKVMAMNILLTESAGITMRLAGKWVWNRISEGCKDWF